MSTLATGINDAGLIVGFSGDLYDRGFVYDGTTFTPVRPGNRTRTFLYGINNAGEIVGGAGNPYFTDPFAARGDHFKALSFPGQHVYAYATGINNFGTVVGWDDYHGYVYSHGQVKQIDFPGPQQTLAWGINDGGVIVGYYAEGGSDFGFALLNGNFASFGYPGVRATAAYGISPSGQLVGAYTDDFITYHGFVTSPIAEAP
ncbi:MAG: hypothetical protein LAN83_01105 [Acidobacteriia bacterium]|nr:hypothetical protein [Terriglobia bacterium]